MAGNTLGVAFRITTWGESHGPSIGVVVDGCPPGIPLEKEWIQKELDRRRPGQSPITTARVEADEVQILSGVFEGKTLGTPICLLIPNQGQHSHRYDALREVFRPGHAEATYWMKYGLYDHRGGGRASARETAARVAAGAVAKRILAGEEIEVYGYTRKVGSIEADRIDRSEIERNPVRCPDPLRARAMEALIVRVREQGDSIGGVVEVVAAGVPAGLGEPVYDKMDADLAKAMMSINAVKGVEIGTGFGAAERKGSENNDPWIFEGGRIRTLTNHCGGILGGITTGGDLVVRIAVKPPSTIALAQQTIDRNGKTVPFSPGDSESARRHDPCICPRVVPVAEAMMAIVLADHLLRQRATGRARPPG
ncbi:MAG: chorismate synthase [bacterium]